jgi:hypothetical protein
MAGFLKPFEIAEEDIAKLDATQFVQLIKRLIQADLQTAQISSSAIEGTLRINIPDGGEDIRVEWSDGPERTEYIPNRCTVFQCKAEKLSDAKIKAEPILEDKTDLKPAVAEIVQRNGAYVLATSKTNTVTPRRQTNGKPKRARQKEGWQTDGAGWQHRQKESGNQERQKKNRAEESQEGRTSCPPAQAVGWPNTGGIGKIFRARQCD